jgi:hypothetical protein
MALKEVKSTAAKTAAPAKPAVSTAHKPGVSMPSVSRDEQVGFHKGALSTLAKEREEMLKILSIVEQLMQMHVAGLKELGIDLEKMAKQVSAQADSKKPASSTPLERKL